MSALINSAAYVNAEMAAEFGELPPAFLPLGTQRLIEHQVSALRGQAGRIYLSLPESFTLDAADASLLRRLDVVVIRVEENIPLGRSVFSCLVSIPDDEALEILHGDTLLIPPRPFRADAWAVAENSDGYRWGYADIQDDRILGTQLLNAGMAVKSTDKVLCGYFSFADPVALRSALTAADHDFLAALSRYAAIRSVTAFPTATWSDFGHLQTYYRSRSAFASARIFNHLRIGNGVVRKSSGDSIKIEAEARWFRHLPSELVPYSARLVDYGGRGKTFWYSTEYEYLPTLQELFVFGRLERQVWRGILESCVECLAAFSRVPAKTACNDPLQALTIDKTGPRMDAFETVSGAALTKGCVLNGRPLPSIRTIASEMFRIIQGAEHRDPCVMHGDYCFSNIMFNMRTRRVRLIDPRGTIDGVSICNAGDFRYDMAKLAHSAVGCYDLIVGGRYDLKIRDGSRLELDFQVYRSPSNEWLADALRDMQVGGVRFRDEVVSAVMITLFIAMLPLHSEDRERQYAFMANVQRLYLACFGSGT